MDVFAVTTGIVKQHNGYGSEKSFAKISDKQSAARVYPAAVTFIMAYKSSSAL